MDKRKIYVTEKDKTKLRKLLSTTTGFRVRDLKTVTDLLDELERAEVITDDSVNQTVVTMNSTVHIQDIETGKEFTYKIVYPEFANSDANRISILAPIGTALLGYKIGDTVEWEVPAGKRKLLVKNIIIQPEETKNTKVEA
ncbi:MAG: nucleoside diphosphate kinase regulator [Ignavibacteriaceae bacterium]|nr:nucleoside diphosphate kinase regulator [Ignavibacteriaceae bacterium]HMN24207.1 nucleoside diphosphate kinase regulator [Ignavibacteriaceae bacterium]HRN26252.1 nucleoside diphosphate kinase regulator [Ignavibacteriaceae bacterium]HRP91911.1 nucleoside diphosphate kinase regulator [Ignavibacteriaceae bacterium]HRQ53836.1 nucleoside diphosphate kinase regulator [Ignavibacteriaceae bacterium]